MNSYRKFEFDTGATSSEGPWLGWSARGSQDGTIPPKSFYLRDGDGKAVFAGFEAGVVFDIRTLRTGWCRSEGVPGVPPEWVWNDTPAKFGPKPGPDFKKGFQIRCAIGGGRVATWEQSGAAAWNALTALIPAIQGGPGGDKLPTVRMTGSKLERFARGSTSTPILEIDKWVDPPACLTESVEAGIQSDAPPEPSRQAGVTPNPAHPSADEF